MATTPKGIVYPSTGEAVTPLADKFAALAISADNAISEAENRNRGLTANRPAPGREGATYYATDTKILWFDNGTVWKNRTRAHAQFTSSTGIVNGNAQVNWTDAVNTSYQEGGVFWSSSTPQRLVAPYTGRYLFTYAMRIQGINPITANPNLNGTTLIPYGAGSGVGAAGASSMAQRTFVQELAQGEFIVFVNASNGASAGSHSVQIEYLGEA